MRKTGRSILSSPTRSSSPPTARSSSSTAAAPRRSRATRSDQCCTSRHLGRIARMKRALLSLLLLALAAPLLADDCGAMTQLATLYELRHIAMRRSSDADSWIDKRLDYLREPS